MVTEACGRGYLHQGGQKAESGNRKESGQDIAFRDNFHHLGISWYILVCLMIYQGINPFVNGSIYQSPQNPITSQNPISWHPSTQYLSLWRTLRIQIITIRQYKLQHKNCQSHRGCYIMSWWIWSIHQNNSNPEWVHTKESCQM
jgi:hypothetical protein